MTRSRNGKRAHEAAGGRFALGPGTDVVWADFVRPYRANLAVAATLAIAQAGMAILQPWPLKVAVDQVAGGHRLTGWLTPLDGISKPALAGFAAASSVALVLASALVGYVQSVLIGTSSERLGADLRSALMERMIDLSGPFYDRHRTGDLVNRLTSDVARVQDTLVMTYTSIVPNVASLVGMTIVLLTIDPILGSVGLAAVPALVVVIRRRRRLVKEAQSAARDRAGALASNSTDLLRNVRIVQAFQRHEQALSQFNAQNEGARNAAMHSIRLDARYSPFTDLILASGSALVLWIGVMQVLEGRLTVGTLLVVLTYVGSVYGPVRSLSSAATNLAKGAASKERLSEVLTSRDRIKSSPGAPPAPRLRRCITFEDVSFEYERNQAVLRSISFTVNAGEHFCIVGASGAGKSTLISLLLRLYDPTRGAVLYDGIDIRNLDVASLRERFGLVPQHPWMIDGTIADNISFGRQPQHASEIAIIGRLALLDEFVDRMSLGYDTPVGEGGTRFSGGQLRRIAFARALVRLPDVLLLDEPTSGLDAHSERLLINAIERVRRGRTVITVSHHLGLAECADRVAVVEKGRVVQIGSPRELRQCDGAYARLLRAHGHDLVSIPTS